MSDFEAQQINLAQRIAAHKRGEGPLPSDEELKAAIDAIRTRRAEYHASTKRKSKSADSGDTKATVAPLDLDNMGI